MTRKRGFACVGIHQPKFEENVGSVLRACGCFGADMVVVAGKRYSSSATDTQKTWKHIPLIQVEDLRMAWPKGAIPVAVDFVPEARSLVNYSHPESAYYIFGGEDRTLDDEILGWCRDRIMIPSRLCLNLAAAVNVVLYDRLAKTGATRQTTK